MNHIFNLISFGDIGSYFQVLLDNPIIIVVAVVILVIITLVIIMVTKPKKHNVNGNVMGTNVDVMTFNNQMGSGVNLQDNGLNNNFINQGILGQEMVNNLNNNVIEPVNVSSIDGGLNNTLDTNLNVNSVVDTGTDVNNVLGQESNLVSVPGNDVVLPVQESISVSGENVNLDNSLNSNVINQMVQEPVVNSTLDNVSNNVVEPVSSFNPILEQETNSNSVFVNEINPSELVVPVNNENLDIQNQVPVQENVNVLEQNFNMEPVVDNGLNEVSLEQPVINDTVLPGDLNPVVSSVDNEVIKPVENESLVGPVLDSAPVQEEILSSTILNEIKEHSEVVDNFKEEFNVNQEPVVGDFDFGQNVVVPSSVAPVVEPINMETIEAPQLEPISIEQMPNIGEETLEEVKEPSVSTSSVNGEAMSFNNMFEATQKIDISSINNQE